MLREAAEAGFYKSSDGTTYPRLQVLTIQQILDGKQPEYPLHRRDATFKKAPRTRPSRKPDASLGCRISSGAHFLFFPDVGCQEKSPSERGLFQPPDLPKIIPGSRTIVIGETPDELKCSRPERRL